MKMGDLENIQNAIDVIHVDFKIWTASINILQSYQLMRNLIYKVEFQYQD